MSNLVLPFGSSAIRLSHSWLLRHDVFSDTTSLQRIISRATRSESESLSRCNVAIAWQTRETLLSCLHDTDDSWSVILILSGTKDRKKEDEFERELKEKRGDKLWETRTGVQITIDGDKQTKRHIGLKYWVTWQIKYLIWQNIVIMSLEKHTNLPEKRIIESKEPPAYL